MYELSEVVHQEVQVGHAVPLEDALKYILDAVEEVVSIKVTRAKTVNAADTSHSSITPMIHFCCRLHDPVSVPLDQFCFMPGIVRSDKVSSTILHLRAHTGDTIRFKF
jgi:hypothetical protein